MWPTEAPRRDYTHGFTCSVIEPVAAAAALSPVWSPVLMIAAPSTPSLSPSLARPLLLFHPEGLRCSAADRELPLEGSRRSCSTDGMSAHTLVPDHTRTPVHFDHHIFIQGRVSDTRARAHARR